jgi:hypothetical protein
MSRLPQRSSNPCEPILSLARITVHPHPIDFLPPRLTPAPSRTILHSYAATFRPTCKRFRTNGASAVRPSLCVDTHQSGGLSDGPVTGTRGERVRKSAPAGFPRHNLFHHIPATCSPQRGSVSRQRLRPWRSDARPAAFRVDDSIRLWFADESGTTFIRTRSATGLEPALVSGVGLCSSLPRRRDRAVRGGSGVVASRHRVAFRFVVGSWLRGGVGTGPGPRSRRLDLSAATDPQGFGR